MTKKPSRQQTVVKDAISDAAERVALRSDVQIENADAASIAAKVATEVMKSPELINAMNDEPWYQSRVTWGGIIVIAVPVMAQLGIATDWVDADQLTSILTALGTAFGAALSLYGRWRAKRPIGV